MLGLYAPAGGWLAGAAEGSAPVDNEVLGIDDVQLPAFDGAEVLAGAAEMGADTGADVDAGREIGAAAGFEAGVWAPPEVLPAPLM